MKAGALVDQLLTESMWSRDVADDARARLPFGWAYAAGGLRPALAAFIDEHDRERPDAPAHGPQRAASIVDWVLAAAAEQRAVSDARDAWVAGGRIGTEPYDRFRDVVAGLHAERDGVPDPTLLRHTARVVPLAVELSAPERPGRRAPADLISTILRTDPDRRQFMRLTTTTIFEGNLARDPELHEAASSGRAYADLVVLVNDPDQGTDDADRAPTRHRVRLFGQMATNAGASLRTGDAVLVAGRVVTDSWADRDSGEKRTAQRVLADAIGASLRFSGVTVDRARR